MAESRTKRPKIEKSEESPEEPFLQYLEQLEKIQEEVENLRTEASKEILKIDQEYNRKYQVHYKKRNEVAANIPHFWSRVLNNHSTLREFITEEDKKVLDYLTEVDMQTWDEVEDEEGKKKSGWRITLRFSENPYFETQEIWKERIEDSAEDGEVHINNSEIKWKPGKDLTKSANGAEPDGGKRKRDEDDTEFSFFNLFTNETEEDSLDDIVEAFREVWPDPLQFYNPPESEEEESSVAEETERTDLQEQEGEEEAEGEGEGEAEGEGEGEGEEEGDGEDE